MFSKSKKMKQKWFNVKLVLTVHDPHTQDSRVPTYSFFCSINFIILLTHFLHYSLLRLPTAFKLWKVCIILFTQSKTNFFVNVHFLAILFLYVCTVIMDGFFAIGIKINKRDFQVYKSEEKNYCFEAKLFYNKITEFHHRRS